MLRNNPSRGCYDTAVIAGAVPYLRSDLSPHMG